MALNVKPEPTERDYTDLLKNTPEDDCTVQIAGLAGYVHANTFNEAFVRIATTQQALAPSDFAVIMETNHETNGCYQTYPVDQFFIKFKNEADACYVLGLERVHITIQAGTHRIVQFMKPTQNTATRAAYRKVTELKNRLPKIAEEYSSIGAIRTNAGKPELPANYKSKAWFMHDDRLPAIERKRKAGKSLDHHELGLLKSTILADTDQLNARIDALYNEECDAWLALRIYQLAGLKFVI